MNDQLAKLEHAVFHARGYADAQNMADALEIGPDGAVIVHDDLLMRLAQLIQDHHRAEYAAQERWDGCTQHSHLKTENQDGVADDVDDIGQDRYRHGQAGIATGAKQRRARIVHGQEGEGQGGDEHIDFGVFHHRILDSTEDQRKQRTAQHQADRADDEGDGCDGQQQLPRRFVGLAQIIAPDILRADDGAARGHGGKQVDHHDVERVHQRYGSDGVRADIADHHGVGHAHQRGQNLLQHQGNQERAQLLSVKHGCFRTFPKDFSRRRSQV